MYSAESIALFGGVKAHLRPRRTCSTPACWSTRAPSTPTCGSAAPAARSRPALRLAHDAGDFADAVHRCTGVGKCLADNTGAGGVMCPSYLATRDEKDSTRGRARVLQDGARRRAGRGWRDPAVARRARPLPVLQGLRVATARPASTWRRTSPRCCTSAYRRRLRPRSHYTLGRLPRWAAADRRAAAGQRDAAQARRVGRLGQAARRRRPAPPPAALSPQPLRVRRTGSSARGHDRTTGPTSWIWADSFTDRFAAGTGRAAIELLETGGLPRRQSRATGVLRPHLDHHRPARPRARKHRAGTRGHAARRTSPPGRPVVGLEPSLHARSAQRRRPSCVDDPRVDRRGGGGAAPLAELLAERTEGWTPPDLTGVEVVAQPHCHHARSSAGRPTPPCSRRPVRRVTRVGGCCGLAGNFGVEKGHYEVSVAVAEHDLLPAVRSAPPGCGRSRRRVLLPHPARRPRRDATPCTSPSCSTSRLPDR